MARIESFRADWIGAVSALNGRESRKVGHNTYLRRGWSPATVDGSGDDRPVTLRYHATDVAEYRADGWTILRANGWHTSTTADRLRQALPGTWSIGSRRVKGESEWWLWHGGYPILPFADGLAVSQDGRVGMLAGGTVGELLGADAIAAIIAAEEQAREDRAAKRAALMLRQHPYARPARYAPGLNAWEYPAGLPKAHGRARPYDCARCDAEVAEWQSLRDAALSAEHDRQDGSHARTDRQAHWPLGVDGRTDYHAQPTYTESVKVECPWDCPKRGRRAM